MLDSENTYRQNAEAVIFSAFIKLLMVVIRPMSYSFFNNSSVVLMRNSLVGGSSFNLAVILVMIPLSLLYLFRDTTEIT